MQLHHCTGQCFFGPTIYPGRRPSTSKFPSCKFQLRQLHVPVSVLLAVVFITKPHLTLANLLEPAVADGAFVGESPQILHHLWEGSGEIPLPDQIIGHAWGHCKLEGDCKKLTLTTNEKEYSPIC